MSLQPNTDAASTAAALPTATPPDAPQANAPLADAPAGVSTAALGVLAACMFLSMLPVAMIVPVLKELVSGRFGGSTFWAHMFMSVNMIGAVVLTPLIAHRLDARVPQRTILAIAALLDAALLWTMTTTESLAVLMVVRFFEGAAHVTVVSTIMALATAQADQARRGRVMGMIGSALMLGTACGPPIGGQIARQGPIAVLHAAAACAMLAGCVAALGVPARRRLGQAKSATRPAHKTAALLRSQPKLLVPYAYAFIDRFCVGVIVSTFILYLGQVLAIDPAKRGLLMALFLIPFALLCYPMGRWSDRIGRVAPMCLGSIAFGMLYACYGLLPAAWLPAAMIASGVLSAVMFSPNLSMCADLAPDESRGAAFAGFNIAGSLGFLAGPLFGGTLLAVLSPRLGAAAAFKITLLAAGLTEIACALITLPWLLRLKRPTPPAP